MPEIPSRRAVLAAAGSLALLFSTTPGTVDALPDLSPGGWPAAAAPGPAQVTACAPPGGGGLNAGIPTASRFARSHGTVTALTLFIDFPGSEARVSTEERFAEFFPATRQYFATSSHGRLDYRPEPVHRWLRMSQPFESYGIDRGVGWHPADPDGYNRLVREIAEAVRDEVDFSAHDLVNVLAAPHAGPSAVEKVLSVSFPGRPLLHTPTGPVQNISFIWSRQPGDSPHRVLVHENGHAFGLPDLYWTAPGEAPLLAGHWDVMEQDWGPSNDFLAWHKWKMEWLTPDQVDCVAGPGVTEHLLSPGGEPGGTKLVAIRTGRHEVLTAEVRARSELDRMVCRPGVLLTRVNTAVSTGEGPARVIDSTPDSGGCQSLPDPQVTAELTDAPFLPGETFRDREAGVRVDVLEAKDDGSHRVRITHD
ncbi:M6 family metalloprotease domain-containing protein [Streptomyces sp. ACA25]|uniref:M6 family metalloprotease domain-containing protein n=1 Tax=Streptomyces sp. ACA25 TaxID=3022596 RepID=UPI002307402C|nr:M6 family metalloprotease domain-containing protein [Streptomyces sp. ACA25]MDB1087336.1 M6 family metalloprotease domain-containing protein [Streptomyces sp. ACA25]